MFTRRAAVSLIALSASLAATGYAAAEDTVKIGLILPMSGQQASTGIQSLAGAKLWIAQHGDKVAGKKVELIVKDDAGVADQTKRMAQELIVNDKVAFLGGFGLTPLALAVSPLITQAKVPAVIFTAATSVITETSPYFVRAGRTMSQITNPIAEWAAKNNIKTVVTLVSDYGPGLDAEKFFKARFEESGGKVLDSLRAPLASPEFAPFLQKAKDDKPDALFLFVPSGQGATLMKQVNDRGFKEANIKVIATGDVTDDDLLPKMTDDVLGMITGYDYSADHDSPANKEFVAAFQKANPDLRPNMMAVAAYDGLGYMYKALENTNGDTAGPKLMDAMKGLSMDSPRGPIKIDPDTRETIANQYIRKVEKKNGQLWNVEFATVPAVADLTHVKK
eukprot:gene22965-24283_t